ncbi:DNRLRE domain-containing protein [Cytobacillus oceanisediminis]|uniref:DNRLRE domain-containing protein n=1 Tax=Cytobacillus oceanisediminis TaxID=665099 RepID=UPI00203E3B3C|nr:DNRLRE domain-containing protein [Cytobacillus oceanisediminis]MCM3405505.1 DNRLRE domain-containing protein [Cytobacillus oceanisediminis]
MKLINRYFKLLIAILIVAPGILYPFKSNIALGADYTSKIYPNADTFVNYGSSYMGDEYLRNSNFGDSTTIEFGRMGNRSQDSFPLYSFDMKQFEGMGGIKTAYLQVPVIDYFKYLDYSDTGFVAYRITDPWDEMTVTAMNKPGIVNDGNPSTLYGGSSWLAINVTKSLQKALELNLPNLEIAIHPASGTSTNSWIGLRTGSREHPDQSKRSYIQVTYDNMKPEISLESLENAVFSEHTEHNSLLLKGSVKDSDLDNTLKILASIDGINFQRELVNFPTTGTQQPFENEIKIDSSIPEGEHILKVWAEDNKGAKSNIIETTIKVDKTSPSIEIDNIISGNTYINEITPSLLINDSSSFTKTIKLNNQPYSEGTKISSTGQHTLEIEAIDQVGNKSNKSVAFSINKTPNISSPIGNQTAKKYDVKEYDLNNVFSDAEGDSLSFQASSSDANIATATIEGNTLKVESLKQGTATIEVTANDGYSTSTADVIQFSVDTRQPILEFTEPKHIIVDDSKQVEVQGTVMDKDLEKVIIQGDINGIFKQTTINETTGNKDDWSLSWDGTDLPTGVYSNFQFQANDEYNGTHSLSYPKAIIKVEGTINEYNPILETYSNDLSKNIQSMTVQQHEELLNVYLAMKELEQSVNPTNLDKAKQMIENLEEGSLKTDYKSSFDTKALGYFIDNINTFNKIDLERIGIQNIVENNMPDYQSAIKTYKDELTNKVPSESLTVLDIQKVIDAINAVIEAEKTVTRNSIDEANRKIDQLQDNENGLLKQLKERVQSVAVSFVINNTGTIHVEDLVKIGIKNVNEESLTTYQNNLTAHKNHLNASQIQVVIDVSNHFNRSLESLSGDHINNIKAETGKLTSGNLKSDMEIASQILDGLQSTSRDWDREVLNQIKNLTPSIQDTKIKIELDTLILSFDKVIVAMELLTNEAIDNALLSIDSLNEGKVKELLLTKVGNIRFDYVAQNPSSIDANDLKRAGIQHVNEAYIDDYKTYLQEYTEEKGSPLTRAEVQLIIDVVNAINKAIASNSLSDVETAIKLIQKMKDGNLSQELLKKMNELKQKLTPISPPIQEKPDKPKENEIKINQNSLEMNVVFDKVKVRTDNAVSVDIDVKAKKDFKDATLLLYYINEEKSDSKTVKGIEKSFFTEVNIGKLEKGETKNLKHNFSLTKSGNYEIGAVLKDKDESIQAENVIQLEVIKYISIPNVQLPTEHGLPVATLTAKVHLTILKKDSKGNFIKSKVLKKGNTIPVLDTTEEHYVVGKNQYIKQSNDLKIHVSLVEIRKETKLMNEQGKVIKTLKPKQKYRMYGFDENNYYLGGGLGVANNQNVVVILGYVEIKDNIHLLDSNDKPVKTLKKGSEFPVYQIQGNKMNLGGGYYIPIEHSKIKYKKL